MTGDLSFKSFHSYKNRSNITENGKVWKLSIQDFSVFSTETLRTFCHVFIQIKQRFKEKKKPCV